MLSSRSYTDSMGCPSFDRLSSRLSSYEPVEAKIMRNFEKQRVIREDPQAYESRYGGELFDPNVVEQQARAIGVLEDLVGAVHE
jgi:hypothetical protein